ncbi:hypothetical protein ACEWY4_026674 [Coilia grayii]|uniref:Fibronectin type-III domain-containing protein n=1 Tax=Coilia grayii TaxID=363190 RepID=A0ABD1ISH0_9TELE
MIPLKSFSAVLGALVIFCTRCCSNSIPDISCYIVNLENVNCSWNCVENLNFSYKFENGKISYCPTYKYMDVCRAGCIFPSENRYSTLSTILSNGTTQRIQTHNIQYAVKLNPPQNLTVLWNSSTGDLHLQWIISWPIVPRCVETEISYRMGERPWQGSNRLPAGVTSYTLAKVSQTKRYLFRVRHRYSTTCGESKLWSDWSEIVAWRPIKARQETDEQRFSNQTGPYLAIGLVSLVIILAVMVRFLLECERIKVILVPVAPDPTKKLNDLFHEYGGNVEGWVRISPQLRDAFDPDYTETTCEVTEIKPTV